MRQRTDIGRIDAQRLQITTRMDNGNESQRDDPDAQRNGGQYESVREHAGPRARGQ